mmetsp:Transcript_44195/g.96118  ORF Transcript_44195/g.96118 Transcript_44195/m.96118 type:complete len:207 (-) Transcript_44195:581-1201(-)
MRIEAQDRISRCSIGAPNDDILQVNPQLHGPRPIWTDLIQHGLQNIVQVSTRNATSFSPGVQQTEPSTGLLPLPAPKESEKTNAAVIQLASVKAIEDELPLAGGSHWFHQSMPRGFWHLPRCCSSTFGQSPGFPPSSSLQGFADAPVVIAIQIHAQDVDIFANCCKSRQLQRVAAGNGYANRVLLIDFLQLVRHPVDSTPYTILLI